jgi:hypothetical protein
MARDDGSYKFPLFEIGKITPGATRLGYANLDFGKLAVFITVRTIY